MKPSCDYLEIYFRDETTNIKVLFDTVGTIEIKNGFLRVYDKIDKSWHCYNCNIIASYHYPKNKKEV